MSRPSSPWLVFTDANVLINLSYVRRLDLLGRIRGYDFVAPEPVMNEIRHPGQRGDLESAVALGHLVVEPLSDLKELETFFYLRLVMGDGEAACLAMASQRGAFILTSDRKRKFRREVRRLINEDRVMNLIGLFVLALEQGLITVDDADGYKATLERHRFKMMIDSFRTLVKEPL